ncbi:glycosyltransferase WbuB [Synechococcus sp. PCC 7336]|uniref:glycosyltransferase WbuB n=1 Tax=Synechococcus sp. PCC 7336 TaxID=195250 RepID=UPI00036CBD61|nr:glycosyltransferase WbuB [Synechococcus sp. PCC 7336]
MRLLICGTNYAPELVGIGKFTSEMAEWLVQQGHEVRVVTALPHYPNWQIDPGYRAWAYCRESIADVDVFRCPVWVKKNPSGLHRVLHLLSFAVSSLPVMLRQIGWRPDAIVAVEPPFSSGPVAALVAKVSGARSWLHIQDFEVDAAFSLGMLPKTSWLERGLYGIEAWLMKQFDTVSTLSDRMLARLHSKGIPTDRTVLFPNWVDTDWMYPMPCSSPLRASLGLSADKVVALYAGSMGSKQGLDLLLHAADRLREHPELHFVLAGEGPQKQRLEALARSLELKNVTFLPFVPIEQFNQLLNLADIHALIQSASVADLVMPSKLTGMMASGRPVLATALPSTAVGSAVISSGCGRLVPPGDVKQFSELLLQLADRPEERAELGRNARRYAEQHMSKRAILSRVTEELQTLVSDARQPQILEEIWPAELPIPSQPSLNPPRASASDPSVPIFSQRPRQ